jgi:L,D-transpeptidase YbiS
MLSEALGVLCFTAAGDKLMFRILIDIAAQSLELFEERGERLKSYPVSTSKNGAGERNGSYCTPRGRHIVRAKIGAGQPANTVFVERRPTGERYGPGFIERYPGRDWILTRILWLSGCEVGLNRLGDVDTMRRYIYIHGSPDDVEMGKPGSIGCIRMRNADIIDLFDRVAPGTPVDIVAKSRTT